jgi:hypothetical protein
MIIINNDTHWLDNKYKFFWNNKVIPKKALFHKLIQFMPISFQ